VLLELLELLQRQLLELLELEFLFYHKLPKQLLTKKRSIVIFSFLFP
jgi:hypothetical protein